MGSGHGAHEEDDRQHHQARRRHCGRPADRSVTDGPDDRAPRGDEHEQERPEQLREQPPPLVAQLIGATTTGRLERKQPGKLGASQASESSLCLS